MTVRQFIKKLEKLPQDAVVTVGEYNIKADRVIWDTDENTVYVVADAFDDDCK